MFLLLRVKKPLGFPCLLLGIKKLKSEKRQVRKSCIIDCFYMTNQSQVTYDVCVIGGGPSGIMAALSAANVGRRVVLIEKNSKLGNKLLLTGGGRCNITQASLTVKHFGRAGSFLFSALAHFGVEETIRFFSKHNLQLKREKKGKMFPASDRVEDVLRVLVSSMRTKKVKIKAGQEAKGLIIENKKIISLKTDQGDVLAHKYILCSGGKSFPKTGSDGGGYELARQAGHTIITPTPALTPVRIKDDLTSSLKGLSFRNVALTINDSHGKKHCKGTGEIVFTHFGISGPLILDASKEIGLFLKDGKVSLVLDFVPDLEYEELDKRVVDDLQKNKRKSVVNAFGNLLPHKIAELVIRLADVRPNKRSADITKMERKRLVQQIKNLELSVTGLMGFNWAMVTSGGVSLKEIDPRTMRSKKISNLFFAGEIIDLDGPTGGYNLQLCWSTGALAGSRAV